MKRYCFIFISVPLVLGLMSQVRSAFADGELNGAASGQFGANRRVRTPDQGYTAVKGNFNIPQESDINIPFVAVPVSAAGIVYDYKNSNRYQSKPSFYLGCDRDVPADDEVGAGLEVDAGLQYEIGGFGGNGLPLPNGWAIFVRTTGKYTDKDGELVNPQGTWRCGPGTANSDVTNINLLWTYYKFASPAPPVYGGYLQVTAIDSAGQPLSSDRQPKDRDFQDNKIRALTNNQGFVSNIITDAIGDTRVKRVVAVTQGGSQGAPLQFPIPNGGKYQEDGSYFRNSTFSDGMVSVQKPPSTGASWSPSSWLTWDAQQTDLSDKSPEATGYYPGGLDHTVIGYRLRPPYSPTNFPVVVGHAGISNEIFQFPGIPKANWDSNNAPTRYANETVSINLEAYIPALGFPITPGSRSN